MKKKWLRKILWFSISTFTMMNIVAAFHAYKFTHFSNEEIKATDPPESSSGIQKLKTLVFGIDNPRPQNKTTPSFSFDTIKLKGKKEIECWYTKAENAKGTVILFHGFAASKSSMLGQAEIFIKLGYNTLLVDFMGSGGSEGNQTTIGFHEAEQVKLCMNYLSEEKKETNSILYGSSMGAVAILKAIDDFALDPAGIILECPFGSMYKTVCARFKTLNVPTFPTAGLLVFWGGAENGFMAFAHNPAKYALSVKCPVLLMYGALDDKVSNDETQEIYNNLGGKKQLKIYPNAGHENYLDKYSAEWEADVSAFLTGKN